MKIIYQNLLVGFAMALVLFSFGETNNKAIASDFTVCPADCSYSSIQAAINAASSGDKIIVQSGTYRENVVVSKNLILEGVDTGSGKPVISAEKSEIALTLSADGIVFDNFQVIRSGYSQSALGIMIRSNANTIKNTDVFYHSTGVQFYYSSNNSFINNNVSNNFTGVSISYSNYNNFTGNMIGLNTSQGIYHYYSSNNTLIQNTISGSQYNFSLVGWSDSHYTNFIGTSNTVDDKPMFYLIGAKDQTFDSSTNAGLFYCVNCDNVTVKDLALSKNRDGVVFYNTRNSRIENATVSNNEYNGIYLAFSSDNTIINSSSLDSFTGIYLIKSNGNLILNNSSFNNRGYGIWTVESDKNTIEKNNVYNNEYGIVIRSNIPSNFIGNMLIDNRVSNNKWRGIRIEFFNNNIITGNTVLGNYYGIDIYSSGNNVVNENTVSDNRYGFYVYGSNSKVYHNNFLNNIYSAYGSYSLYNLWDNSYPSGGNYWSDYTGADEKKGENQDQSGSDGIGDAAYAFIGGVDRFPFMKESGWKIIPPPLPSPNPSLSISNLKQFKSDSATQIVEGSITTESAIVFKATLSDLDNNQVKLQIEFRKKDEQFTGIDDGGILNSDFIDSGSEAVITKYGLIDGQYHWRARAVDDKGSFSEWQEFSQTGNVDFEVKTVPLYTQVRSGYPSDDETKEWATQQLGNGGTGGFAEYRFSLATLANYSLTINGKDDNAANGARATLGVGLYKLGSSFKVFRTMSWPSGNDAYKDISSDLGALSKGDYLLRLTSIVDYFDVKYNTTKDETYDLNVYLDWIKITNTTAPDSPEIKIEAEDSPNIRGGSEEIEENKTIVKIYGYSCGGTIADCGCAMASMVILGRYYDIKKGIDNSNVDPENLNAWLANNKGYIANGGIIWSKGIEYLGYIENGKKKVRLSLDRHNASSKLALIDDEYINKAKPAISQNKKFGHFFIVDGKIKFGPGDNDYTHTVKDPYWYNTKTLRDTKNIVNHVQDYNNYYDSTNLFSYLDTPKIIASSIWIVLGSPAELLITDPLGKRLGKDPISGIDYNEISGGSYTEEVSPPITSKESLEPENIHLSKIIYISEPIEGNYNIQVIGTNSGNYTIDALIYDNEGNSHSQVLYGNMQMNLIADYNFNFTPDNPEDIIFQSTDQTAPITSLSLLGIIGDNGWFHSDVQISVSSQDNQGGVGVFEIEYSLNGGNSWLEYTHSFLISQEGIQTVMYHSRDFNGNLEETKSWQIGIDKTPPEAKIYFDQDSKSLKIEGTDNLSSTETIQEDKTFIVQDESGHNLKLIFNELKRHGKEIKAELKSLQYNSGPLYEFPTNFKYEWSLDKNGGIKELEQKIESEGQFEIKAKYNHQKDETRIKVKQESEEEIEQIFQSLAIVRLVTNSGLIGFEF